MPRTALVLYLGFLAVAFGWRTWLQYRLTGDHGFRGFAGQIGSVPWFGGLLLTLGTLLGLAAPVGQWLGLLQALPVESPVLHGIGLLRALSGFGLTVAAQVHMRASWRVGVDEQEKTPLVRQGLFAHVRNPIFTGMLLAQAGLLLLVPNLLSVAALGSTLVGLEIQVRKVEEPYLLRTHGSDYLSYARVVGRFVPWLGRLT